VCEGALHGNDIVDSVNRLCAMNLYLHGIGTADGECPVLNQDALAKGVGDKDKVDMVFANSPFSVKTFGPPLQTNNLILCSISSIC
jgi:type I restriction enzyme M protein